MIAKLCLIINFTQVLGLQSHDKWFTTEEQKQFYHGFKPYKNGANFVKYFKENKDDVITGPNDPRLATTDYKREKQEDEILRENQQKV